MLKASNRRKYLTAYAEPEAKVIAPEGKTYDAAIVVPACGETHDFLDRWQQNLRLRSTAALLVVLVVNADAHTAPPYTSGNERLIADILAKPHVTLAGPTPIYLVSYDAFDVLLIDRATATHHLPPKCGVGLARKIGGDVVCAWHERGVVTAPFWLSTDADVELPRDIVDALEAITEKSGIVCLPFTHLPSGNDRVDAATFAVEVELRYHALGLAYAGSNYAWPALGSCLAIHVDTYAAVRGFPKRQAGEDHYLLQKATKLAPVGFGNGTPIGIHARRSARTPFGTGRSVEELLRDEAWTLRLRHPECYAWLRRVLTWLAELGRTGDWPLFAATLAAEATWAKTLASILENIGAWAAWQHTCRQPLSAVTRSRRLHEWFDGLRQIQFLKGLEHTLEPLPAERALCLAAFTKDVLTAPERLGNDVAAWRGLAQKLAALPLSRPLPFGV